MTREQSNFGSAGMFTTPVQPTTTNTVVKIGWGESRVVQIPGTATWTATYKRFDGKTL
jgi:hypothetical protein